MKTYLDKILSNELLTFDESKSFIHSINDEEFTPEVLGGVLIGLEQRGIQLEELKGFRAGLLELVTPVELEFENAIDLCGTGGDGKNTFNISSTTSLVLAAMGKKVIKHGNYGVSSVCGSSDVLKNMGFQFKTTSRALQQDLDRNNICFIHAPLFHPAMKKVAGIRKNLGRKTLFNALGPLVNPVQPNLQLTGTYSLELAKMYQLILKNNRTNYAVVHGMDGYDEISFTDSTRVFGKFSDNILLPSQFGLPSIKDQNLAGGSSITQSAQMVKTILKGNGSISQTNVVAINTATALNIFEPSASLKELFEFSQDFIKKGHAFNHFKFN